MMNESLIGSSEKDDNENPYKQFLVKSNDKGDLIETAKSMIGRIEKHGTIDGFPDENLEFIIETALSIVTPLPAMIDVTAPVVIFGDLHGQLSDFLKYLNEIGRPPVIQFLFLGDVVDRGTRSLEIVFWILCMMCMHPQQVHWIRGNHEVRRINRLYGFREELLRKRNIKIWKLLNDIFSELPVCANINRKILCMHGGLSQKITDWQSLTQLKKPRTPHSCDEDICMDLLWADPNLVNDEYKFNTSRGISCLFPETMVKNVCKSLQIDMIIRAHEVKMKGHEFSFDNRLLTVFSAPYYSGKHSNFGSVAQISRTLKLRILTLKPMMKLEVLKEEKTKMKNRMLSFKPNMLNPSVTCLSHQTSSYESEEYTSKFLGDGEMYAHDVKNCNNDRFEHFDRNKTSKENIVSLSDLKHIADNIEKTEKKPKSGSLSLETEKEVDPLSLKTTPKVKTGESSPRGSKENTS